jgi:hypothetical protein
MWLSQQVQDRPADAYRLLSEAIVPPTATDFVRAGHEATHAAAGRPTRLLEGLAAQAAFLRSLADNVEGLDLMPDWEQA